MTWKSFVTFGTLIWHPQFVPITLNEALEFLRYHFETGLRHFATQTARKMAKMSLGVRRMSVFCYFCESNFGQAQSLEYRLNMLKTCEKVEKVCVSVSRQAFNKFRISSFILPPNPILSGSKRCISSNHLLHAAV